MHKNAHIQIYQEYMHKVSQLHLLSIDIFYSI